MSVPIEKVTAREKDFEELWARMKDDLEIRYYLQEFTLKDTKGNEITNADNVTLNDPRTDADRVISVLGTANRLFNITGCDPSDQRHLEEYFKLMFDLNDEILAIQLLESLNFTIDFFTTLRGWVGVRPIMYRQGKKWQPEFLPIDPYGLSWEVDRKGVLWGSYFTRMTGEQVNDLTGWESSGGKPVDLRTVWDRETCEYFVANEKVGETIEHKLGICPIAVIPVPTHPLLVSSDSNGLVRQGESIYPANREIYEENNDILSVWKTINKEQFLTPLILKTYRGEGAMTERPSGPDSITQIEPEESIEAMPTRDFTVSSQNLVAQLEARKQRGSLSSVDYSELSFELSALAISQLKEGRDQIFKPRLKAKGTAFKRICHLVKQQILKGGYKTDLGDEDLTMEIEDKYFKENFQISIDFYDISPEQNIANLNVASLAKPLGVSKLDIFRDILKFEDPEEAIRRSERENAHAQIPELRLFDWAMSLGTGDLDEEEIKAKEAQIVMWKLEQLMNQREGLEEEGVAASQPKMYGGIPRSVGQRIAQTEQSRQMGRQQTVGQKGQRTEIAE